MQFNPLPIVGAYEILLSPFRDERGVFSRVYCQEELAAIGHTKTIVQVNHSLNKEKATIRGMHFQHAPFAEIKIIRCLKGKVFDVMVDLRRNSVSFLQWHAVELSPDKYNLVYIPEGCAHGFQTLEPDSELLYFHTAAYNRASEGALRYDDPVPGIQWPLPPVNISEKDKSYALLDTSFTGVTV
jgi:dTDP-4-dehydrorhamnose 3,5-epimerase